MKILFSNTFNAYNRPQNKNGATNPNIGYNKGWKADTVSFTALKKSKLNEFDLACANKFSAPIEKFNSDKDFQNWAKNELDKKTALSQYKNTEPKVEEMVKKRLHDWQEFLSKNERYSENSTLSLVIFNSITKELKPNSHKLPPLLDEKVLAQTVDELKQKINDNPKTPFSFGKMYQNNLTINALETAANKIKTAGEGHWVVIPSKTHDPENFKDNVIILQNLSSEHWCTKHEKAEEELAEGDFCIYLKDNKPKACIWVDNYNEIREIQGETNNYKIPLDFFDEIKTLVDKNKLKGFEIDLEYAKIAKEEISEIKETFADDFKNKCYTNILEHLGYGVKVLDDGLLELESFQQPQHFTFDELGVDENALLKSIKKINGYAFFENCSATSLGNIESIGQSASFRYSEITDLGKLKTVGKDLSFVKSKVKNIDSLRDVGGLVTVNTKLNLDFSNVRTEKGFSYW